MPGSIGFIFSSCIGFLFLSAGIFGICKIILFLKRVRALQRVDGILVDYWLLQKREEDGFCMDYFYPIYEYEWKGETRKLHSKVRGGSPYWLPIDMRVHIYVDSLTENASCLEDQTLAVSVPLTFGALGLVILILTLLISAVISGVFPC